VNFTAMVQLANAVRLAPQVVVLLKSAASVPPNAILLIVIVTLRLLASVTDLARLVLTNATLPKLTLAGDSVAGSAAVP
jgi:hypothetical protein